MWKTVVLSSQVLLATAGLWSSPSSAQKVDELREVAKQTAGIAAMTFFADRHCGGGKRSPAVVSAIEASKSMFPTDYDVAYVEALGMLTDMAKGGGEKDTCTGVLHALGPSGVVMRNAWTPNPR